MWGPSEYESYMAAQVAYPEAGPMGKDGAWTFDKQVCFFFGCVIVSKSRKANKKWKQLQ